MPEYLEFRCCMCPQTGVQSAVCPSSANKPETHCRFVKSYIDNRGWKYRVMPGLGTVYKARYQNDTHKGEVGWHGIRQLEWRESFDKAQKDLNALAKKKGWGENAP